MYTTPSQSTKPNFSPENLFDWGYLKKLHEKPYQGDWLQTEQSRSQWSPSPPLPNFNEEFPLPMDEMEKFLHSSPTQSPAYLQSALLNQVYSIRSNVYRSVAGVVRRELEIPVCL